MREHQGFLIIVFLSAMLSLDLTGYFLMSLKPGGLNTLMRRLIGLWESVSRDRTSQMWCVLSFSFSYSCVETW